MPAPHEPSVALSLRLATDDDIRFLATGALLLAQQEITDSKLTLSPTISDELNRYYQVAINDPSMLILIAESTVKSEMSKPINLAVGFLVGAIQASPNAYTSLGQFASIHTLWVDPEHRKQKIARQLVHAFERTVAEHGISIVDVAHMTSNLLAERFWQELGYDAVSVTRRKQLP